VMPIRARALGFPAATFLAMVAALPAAAAGAEYEVVPEEIVATPWVVAPAQRGELPLKGRTISIWVVSGYCIGEPKPRFDRIKVVERPKTESRPFKSAVITIILRRPAYERPMQPPNTDNVIYNACAGLGLIIRKRIKLKRPAADLRFFDGRSAPPRRVRLHQ
jgi:hypothetical protein